MRVRDRIVIVIFFACACDDACVAPSAAGISDTASDAAKIRESGRSTAQLCLTQLDRWDPGSRVRRRSPAA